MGASTLPSMSSPRKRGPITTGRSGCAKAVEQHFSKTGAAAYGSLLSQGRRCRDTHQLRFMGRRISRLIAPSTLVALLLVLSRARMQRGALAPARRSRGSKDFRNAPLAQQPGMDDLPLVVSAGPELQQRRPPVLQLAEKLQRVGGRCPLWIIRLGLTAG